MRPPAACWAATASKAPIFTNSTRAPLSRRDLGVVEIFFAIFGHHPWWVKLLLILRNAVAARAGLAAPTASEILHVAVEERYVVGDKIGVWPIFALGENEIVAGRETSTWISGSPC